MPPVTTFILGVGVGSLLLGLGIAMGYWTGRKSRAAEQLPGQEEQFLSFLRTMSQWTSKFSGDISKYQDQLTHVDERVRTGKATRDELLTMVTAMMETNRQLKHQLETTEKKLELQTDQLANFSNEARTDALTGLLNRRAFDKATDELFATWQKNKEPFAIGLIDIDHFKKINDTHGHPAGDAVLKQVGGMLKAKLPDAVCTARYGGEEFGILWTVPVAEAALLIDSLRDLVAKQPIEHDGKSISVTFSAGLAQIHTGERIGSMVRRADQALYASKHKGRNRVHLHDGQGCRQITPEEIGVLSANQPAQITTEQLQKTDEVALTRVQERLRRIVEEESQRLAEH